MFVSVHTEELVNLCVVRCNRASVCECVCDLSFVLYCFCVFKEKSGVIESVLLFEIIECRLQENLI